MRLRILAVGSRLPAWAEQGIADFHKRFPRTLPVRIETVEAAPRKGGRTAEQLRAADSQRLLARIKEGERVVALDERGRQHSTRGLTARLEAWQQEARDVCLVIGGPDGHDETLRQRADELLSLSQLTLPHALARLLLMEQLYRAWSLQTGHPYHRE